MIREANSIMTPIECTISDGFVYVSPNTSADLIKLLYNQLMIRIPGAEHTDLFKRGQWDGTRKFFVFRYKCFPVGLLPWVERTLLVSFVAREDDRSQTPIPFFPVIIHKDGKDYPMRDFQEESARLLLEHHGGLASVATNGGKTAIIASIVLSLYKVGKKVLILEGMINLLTQVKKEVESCIGFEIDEYTAKNKTLSTVSIAMVPSLARRLGRENVSGDTDLQETLKVYDAIIVDECHHAQAETYNALLTINPRVMRFGLSGTVPLDSTFHGLLLRSVFGEVYRTVGNTELITRGISAKPTINMIETDMDYMFDKRLAVYKGQVHPTCMKLNPRRKKMEFCVPMYVAKIRHFVMDEGIRHHEESKRIIGRLLEKHKDQSTVVLVDWVEYSEDLAAAFSIPVFHGKTKKRDTLLEDFSSGKIKHLIATSVLDEGLSIDCIEVLILANAGKSRRQFLQRLGRGLRKKENVNELNVYDFLRYGHKYLEAPSKERYQLWNEEGFDIKFLREKAIC